MMDTQLLDMQPDQGEGMARLLATQHLVSIVTQMDPAFADKASCAHGVSKILNRRLFQTRGPFEVFPPM